MFYSDIPEPNIFHQSIAVQKVEQSSFECMREFRIVPEIKTLLIDKYMILAWEDILLVSEKKIFLLARWTNFYWPEELNFIAEATTFYWPERQILLGWENTLD